MKRLIAIALIWSAAAMPPLSGGDLPPGFPLPIAGANVQTEAKFQLGRLLFYDRRLSYNGTQSCADCHQQKLAFTDGRARAIGSTGQQHARNAMTLTNAAYNATYTWTGTSVRTLEQQALVPMLNEHPIELGVRNHQREIAERLQSDPDLVSRFRAAFPGERRPVSLRNIANALASFEREMISGHSPYDQLVYGGDERALSPEAWRGMNLFYSPRAGCSGCHRGFNFSGDVRYAGSRNGRPRLASNGVTAGEFRVPTLRNVALTAPYMHDGSLDTLEAVIGRYSEARRLSLSAEEKSDLIAFLKSLTDVSFVTNPRLGDPRQDR